MPETRGRSLEDIQQAFHHPALGSLASKLRRRTGRNTTEEVGASGAENENAGIELRSSALEATAIHASPVGVGSLARGLRVDA